LTTTWWALDSDPSVVMVVDFYACCVRLAFGGLHGQALSARGVRREGEQRCLFTFHLRRPWRSPIDLSWVMYATTLTICRRLLLLMNSFPCGVQRWKLGVTSYSFRDTSICWAIYIITNVITNKNQLP
jgi:hypothetical protein